MGGGTADERQTRLVPLLESILMPGRQEMASLPIPDELLVDIFLRLTTPADLVCASAACVSFRRVAADRSFLRRYRKLHAPPILGFLEYERKVFHAASPPHPSATAATAVALAADFSFSFLPAPANDWMVMDIRDGRVLLDRPAQRRINNIYSGLFEEVVVCDPLQRRHLLLPPIPDNLAASVEDPLSCETFLAPPGGDDEEAFAAEETSFSVIWMAQCRTELVAFIFCSSTKQWQAISSQSWSDLFAGLLSSTWVPLFFCRQYAYGCFYWVTGLRDRLLVLDTRRMEFSVAEAPPEASLGVDIAIVEAGEGMTGMFVLGEDANASYLNYTIRRNICGNSDQWQFEKTISLDFRCSVIGSAGRHLFLYLCRSPAGCFLLDVKTLQLERVFISNSCRPYGSTYGNFPPSLLLTPTISSGVEKGSEKEMLEQGCAASSSAQSPPRPSE